MRVETAAGLTLAALALAALGLPAAAQGPGAGTASGLEAGLAVLKGRCSMSCSARSTASIRRQTEESP